MSKRKVVLHVLFLISPLLFFGCIVVPFMFSDYMETTEMLIAVFRGYTAVFFLISSYMFYRLGKFEEMRSFWDGFIRNGYPIGASTLFAWVILLPLMKKTVGMWDSQFLNFVITLILGYAVFFFFIGLYEVLSLIFKNKQLSESK